MRRRELAGVGLTPREMGAISGTRGAWVPGHEGRTGINNKLNAEPRARGLLFAIDLVSGVYHHAARIRLTIDYYGLKLLAPTPG